MSYHWIYSIGSKACAWSGTLAKPIWPQSPCNVDEAWSMGTIVVVVFALLAFFTIIRRADAWYNYYRR